MINPEQVPDEVVAAAREAWLRSDVSAKEDWRASIAAALNAWPGMGTIMLPRMMQPGHFVPQDYIRLPLTEKPDGE